MTDPPTPPDPPEEEQSPHGEHHDHARFVQAPIAPLDENGIVVTTVGTALFAVAALVLGLQYDRLLASGHGWWLAVVIAGAVLGLVGLAYCWRRRAAG